MLGFGEASSAELARIALPLARWAGEAAATARQLADNLQAAETTSRLLAPRQDRTQRYLWLPTSQGRTGPHPAVTAAAAAAAELTAAEQPLAALAGIPTATEQAAAAKQPPPGPRSPTYAPHSPHAPHSQPSGNPTRR